MSELITITDGYTLNPGDLSWDAFNTIGKVHYYDRSPADTILKHCKDATIILTNKTPLTGEVISQCTKLKLIAVTATGYNIVDVATARRHGVTVCNVPGYGTDSVAQHTFALILELMNHVGLNSGSVHNGEWSSREDFCYTKAPIIEIAGKALGLVGYGMIGRKVAEIGRAFGMKVIYSRNAPDPDAVTIEQIFSTSDVISLHCPLTKENHQFVNGKLLALMKPGAILINTARGQLINEKDLAAFLKANKIRGAALDVLSSEPPPKDHPLIGVKNCIITPHNAWYSFEARKRIMDITYQNVVSALKGVPQNVVN